LIDWVVAFEFIKGGLKSLSDPKVRERLAADPEVRAAAAPLIQRLVHQYLLANREQLVMTGKAIDRAYLEHLGINFAVPDEAGHLVTLRMTDPKMSELIAAIANAFIDKGLEETS
jgi:hypothetical protein